MAQSPSLEDLQQLCKQAFDNTGTLNPIASALKDYLDLLEVVREQGFAAGLSGERTCPYPDGSLAAAIWFAGYNAGAAQAARARPIPSRGPSSGPSMG